MCRACCSRSLVPLHRRVTTLLDGFKDLAVVSLTVQACQRVCDQPEQCAGHMPGAVWPVPLHAQYPGDTGGLSRQS